MNNNTCNCYCHNEPYSFDNCLLCKHEPVSNYCSHRNIKDIGNDEQVFIICFDCGEDMTLECYDFYMDKLGGPSYEN